MNRYSFHHPLNHRAERTEVQEDELEDYLSHEDFVDVVTLDIGDMHEDEEGFIWRRDA